MKITDDSNEGQNGVGGGGDTEERELNITEMNNTTMPEDNSNTNPPAEMSVQKSSPVTLDSSQNLLSMSSVPVLRATKK